MGQMPAQKLKSFGREVKACPLAELTRPEAVEDRGNGARHMTSGPRQIREPLLKRPFDFVLALIGLLLSSPLWLIASLTIYLEDRGSVFFSQERCGKSGKLFRTVKFRTMKQPKEGEVHVDVDLESDFRVTKVGILLRATALDELPGLINILKGEMSFVGPRPLPYRIEDEESSRYRSIDEVPGYDLRCRVRPGLTGLAQIYAPKNVERRNKFRYDAVYVRRMSFWLDLRLLFLSFWVTFRGGWERRGKKV